MATFIDPMVQIKSAELTSAIRKLRKSDLEAECLRVQLSTSGTRDELRQRLLEYARRNPKSFQIIITAFQLSAELLEEELLENNVEVPQDSYGDLVYAWITLMRRKARMSTETEEIPPTTPTFTVNLEPPKPNILDIVRRWNIKFKPGDSVYLFLERLEDLKQASKVRDEDLLGVLPEILQESALLWYRNRTVDWETWNTFLKDFKVYYLPLDEEDALQDEIRNRTQGPRESITDYTNAVQTLIRRLNTPMSPPQILKMLIKNLRPDVKLYIRPNEVQSVSELITHVRQYEQILLDSEKYVPPPTQVRSTVKETAYKPQNQMAIPNLNVILNQPQKGEQSVKRDVSVSKDYDKRPLDRTIDSVNRKYNPVHSVQSKMVQKGEAQCRTFPKSQPRLQCWNCDRVGHRKSECRAPVRIICYNCRGVGHKISQCKMPIVKGDHSDKSL